MASDGRAVVLRASDVSKRFGPTQALDSVSLELERGKVHALLGGNGSGKSTLIKILAGVLHADHGTLEIGSQTFDLRTGTAARSHAAGLRFVHQHTSTFADLTVAENLALGHGFATSAGRIRWHETRRRAAEVLARFEIDADPNEELGALSPAMQKMVAIARALQDQEEADHGVLVLDEPTAALPDAEVGLLLDALRRYAAAGQTIVYVTHRLEEVFAVADHATLLRDARLIATVAPRDLTHDDLVELITGRSPEQVERLRGQAAGPVVLELKDVATGRLGPLSLSLRAGEIVGVAGLIGSGRSTLLKALFGTIDLQAGEVRLDGHPAHLSSPRSAMADGFAYVPEDRLSDAVFTELTVKENLSITALDRYWRKGILRGSRERRDADRLLTDFVIKAENVDSPLTALSGGNQQKVILARWLRRDPRVILLDEPTQGVDVGARVEIYELVKRAAAAGAVAMVASSDAEELAAICDRVVVLRKGRVVTELTGDALTSEAVQRIAHTETEVAA